MRAVDQRQLSVFFEAGGARYALDALRVTEVARPDAAPETLHGNLAIKDLSGLLGGGAELRPGTVVVLDTSPTAAVRAAQVEGVFVSPAAPLPLPRRLIPLLAPAVRSGVLREGRLYFELDADGLLRGLPRQTRRRERVLAEPIEQCLAFESAGQRFAVPLSHVLQVVSTDATFNRAPSRGEFLGVVVYLQHLHPVFSVSDTLEPEPLVVLVDSRSEPVGLSATRALGVLAPAALGDAAVLDVERMFS